MTPVIAAITEEAEMRVLLIDDQREAHLFKDVTKVARTFRVARTFDEGIRALGEGDWDLLLLDHDLADETGSDLAPRPEGKKEWTGYDVMCWLEQHPELLPSRIQIVSANPVGVERMRMVIRKLYQS